MNKKMSRWMLGLAVMAGTCGLGAMALHSPAVRAATADEQVAQGDQLKSEAFHELREGHFDRSTELLSRAAQLLKDHDPAIAQMAGWSSAFEQQREGFMADRHKQYDAAVRAVHKLLDLHKDRFVLDEVVGAYVLADDKTAFVNDQWVKDLIAKSIQMASKDDDSANWLESLRLYADLGALQPSTPLWKDKLKSASRRLRLLAEYAPQGLKTLQDAELKARKESDAIVLAIIHPDSSAVTKPAADAKTSGKNSTDDKSTDKDDSSDTEAFRTDWKDTLKGVRLDTLGEALNDARVDYYRYVSQRDTMLGGLNGVRAIVTTQGMNTAFPSLDDAKKKAQFLERLDALTDSVKNTTVENDAALDTSVLPRLKELNADTLDLPENVLANEFADGAFEQLDPFSNVIWPAEWAEFKKLTSGEFSGVGIQIQSDKDGSLRVVTPLPDSPAERAGIRPHDVIIAINGKSARGISINSAVKNITGESGTLVTLTILHPDGTKTDVTLKRQLIKVDSFRGWKYKSDGSWDYMIDPAQGIAYLRLSSFTETTGEELDRISAMLKKNGAKGIILDLRSNPGGLLTAAIAVCDKFLTNGVIVSTHADRETPNPPFIARASNTGDELQLPLVVLVNQYSASASEIVSGCLKDDHRALIVGERTYGKGSVQMLLPLGDTRLKLTTSHYYLPGGRCIHREENSTVWGVDPDVTVEMTPDQSLKAIDARQAMDELNDDGAHGAPHKAADKPKVDPLSVDAQLDAALLLIRMELSGAQI